MVRHTKKTNVLETVKVPLQYSKTDKTIFAYLRRSTKKEEQRESKQKQNDSIDLMAKDLGINIEDIQIFEDDFTGFKINTKNGKPQTKRKGYIALMEAIDKCKVPCILLAYDCSRLARNVPDGITICEKLWLYGNKQKIEYIRFYDGTKWDKTTRDKTINDAFSEANWYSEALSKQKQDKNITSLRRGIMPKTIKAPHGLRCTDKGLEETNTMPYIYRAFEMKVEGTLGKDISKYLISHWIPVSEGNLAFMVFQKTQYIGEYTHSKTGDVFDKLRFISGKTAIPRHLWDKVQARLGKKVWGYGEKQQGDIIVWLLRWKEDKTKSFSLDIKTKPNGKQHKYYKSNSFWGINIGEKRIIEEFIKNTIPKIVSLQYTIYKMVWEKTRPELEIYEEELRNLMSIKRKQIDPKTDEEMNIVFKEYDKIEEAKQDIYKRFNKYSIYERIKDATGEEKIRIFEKLYIEWETEEFKRLISEYSNIMRREHLFYGEIKIIEIKEIIWKKEEEIMEKSKLIIKNMYKKQKPDLEKTDKEITKSKLEIEKQKKEDWMKQERINLTKLLAKGTISEDAYNDVLKDSEEEIRNIENQIVKLWENTDMEQFIERLPEVLNKTFELASKVLSNEDIRVIKKDIEQLLEICTFELTINAKKELKIKLFEWLECWKISVVGDIRFELMTLCV